MPCTCRMAKICAHVCAIVLTVSLSETVQTLQTASDSLEDTFSKGKNLKSVNIGQDSLRSA